MNFEVISKKATVLVLILLSGCTMIPDYEQPELPVAETWDQGDPDSALEESLVQMDWREFYSEPDLQQIIEVALANNRDLKIATLSVERMEVLLGVQKLALFPQLNLLGSESRSRSPADLSYSGTATTTSTYQVGLQVPAYELDFFGRVRSLKEQALEGYLATQEAKLSYQSSLIKSVSSQYYSILAYNSQLGLLERALASSEKNLELVQSIYESGAGAESDLRIAEGQVHNLRASVASLDQQIAQAKNSMVLLVGTSLPVVLDSALPDMEDDEALPAGLPSDLLIRRPDIRAAEHMLKAANANIGVARAAFFPKISLTAFGGTASSDLDGLFKDGSGIWSFVPSVSLPIFSGGRNTANLKIAEIEKRVEIANYEKSIQTAFREVADGLAAQSNIDRNIQELDARLNAAERRYELAEVRYEGGVDSYLTVLQAEQERVSAEETLLQARLAKFLNRIQLFSALGLQVD